MYNSSRGASYSEAIMYTDGACSNNGRGEARAGIGVYDLNNPCYNISEPIGGRQTNQRAEIIAAKEGIESAIQQGYYRVTIRTDSNYVKNAAETWIENWEHNGWYSNGQPVVNRIEFQDLRDAMSRIPTEFEWIPSSQNKADPLAREGARKGLAGGQYYR